MGRIVTASILALLISLTATFNALATEQEPTSPYRDIIMNMTEEEIVEIQQVLCLEAGIDTWEGRIATAQVIFNRVLSEDPYYPDTVHGVLSQKGQYSTYKRRHKAQYGERESDAIEFLCDCNAEDLIIGTDRLFQDCKPKGKDPIRVGKQYFGK